MTGEGWTWRVLSDAPADEQVWSRLFRECFGKDKDAATLRWKYRDNPDGPALSLAAVDPATDAVVGTYAYMPRRFLRDGEPVTLMQASDAMTTAAWRGQGIFTGLDDEVCRLSAEQGVPWAFAYSGRLSYKGFLKNGWELLGYATEWRLPFRARPWLRRRGRLGSVGLTVAERILDHCTSWHARTPLELAAQRAGWERLERFDESVDALFERCAPREGLVGVRSARWLNWRYVDTPSRRQECFGIHRDGRLAGYVVCEWHGGHGFLVDLLAEDAATRGALLAGFTVESHARGCEEATALVCEHHPAVPDLIALGFKADRRRKPWRDVYPFIVRECGPPPMGPDAAPPEADRDLGRWNLADGDRDAEHMSA